MYCKKQVVNKTSLQMNANRRKFGVFIAYTPWEVELFFKWIKQNLKTKSFIGTSENAVMTQIPVEPCN